MAFAGEPQQRVVQQAIDTVVGTGAISMPFWIQVVERGMGFAIAAGGVVLVVLRIAIAWRDFKAKRK